MPNFPGSEGAVPAVYTDVETVSSGVSIPSGVRTPLLMGEGVRRETLVSSANGGGNDGWNPTFTSTSGAVGRYFRVTYYPIISNRTTLYKSGVLLSGTEGSSGTFNTNFDYQIDPATGEIILQEAHLVDLGGSYWTLAPSSTGDGYISGLTLEDLNAPNETWTIRCSSVQRDGTGAPISGTAKFVATGSVSGTLLDGYGNVIFWQSNGVTESNTILSFAIYDGSVVFREGDRFTVQVKSGVLAIGDSLVANYIYQGDLNVPQFFTDNNTLSQAYGMPSLTNRLSLGAQLAFANSPVGVYANLCAPSVPRRVSYLLRASASGGSAQDDLTFALPVGVTPDADSNINFFVTNPITGVETQILPNKVGFYDPTITANPYTAFITSPSYNYSYTVIESVEVAKQGEDGVLVITSPTTATFSSSSVTFGLDDNAATRSLYIYDALNPTNDGSFVITGISGGKLLISTASGIAESSLKFEVLDTAAQSAEVLFTQDLSVVLVAGATLRCTLVDTRDSTFFDAGWVSAYEAIEAIDIDIVVPLPSQTISVIFQNGATHVKSQSNIKNKHERMLFIGAIKGLTPANVIGTQLAAVEDIGILEGIQGDTVSEILAGNTEDLANYGVRNAYGNTYRVVYFYPDEIIVQVGSSNLAIDGFFIAAAAAGYLSGVPNVALPLTRKVLTGFTILNSKRFRPVIIEQIVAAGITLLQPVQGGGTVIRGQTTTNSGFLEEIEISIVFIRDRIAKMLRTAFDGFVGDVDSPIFFSSVNARAVSAMNGFIGSGLITAYKDLKIVRDSVDPTQFDITVKVQPSYPVNFIYIKVEVGVISG